MATYNGADALSREDLACPHPDLVPIRDAAHRHQQPAVRITAGAATRPQAEDEAAAVQHSGRSPGSPPSGSCGAFVGGPP